MTWHVAAEDVERYALGVVDDARAGSIEAHLLACASCRAATRGAVPRERLDGTWESIDVRLFLSRRRPVERLLAWCGVPEHIARLLAATPSLTLSWLVAVTVALGFAVLAAHAGGACGPGGCGGVFLFLVVAPLVPLAGVAAAYGPGIDPTYEIGLAAPMRSYRLLLIRALAVLASSSVLAGVAALALPGLNWTAGAWLLPALALAAATLALSTFWQPSWAALAVALAWVALVVGVELTSIRELAAFRAGGQIGFLMLAAVSSIVLARRRLALDFRRAT